MRAWFDERLKYQHVQQLRLPKRLPKVGAGLPNSYQNYIYVVVLHINGQWQEPRERVILKIWTNVSIHV